jgi:hypothetical protein
LSQFVVLTSPLHLLTLKILEFANSIRSFSKTAHNCLYHMAQSLTAKNFSITTGKRIPRLSVDRIRR